MVGLAIACWSARSRAESEDASFTLDYSVPAGCPTRAQFIEAVRVRSSSAREVEGTSARVALSLQLLGGGSSVSGFLDVRLEDGQQSRRGVPQASCRDVVNSMALIAAMVLEGGGLDAPVPRARTAPAAPSRLGPRGTSRKDAKLQAVILGGGRNGQEAGSPWRFGIVLGGTIEPGVAPSLAWGVGAGLNLGVLGSGLVAPSFRLAARWVRDAETTTIGGYGAAEFRLLAATALACPLRWPERAPVALRPCALLDVGELQVQGKDTLDPKRPQMLWLGFGLAARAEMRLQSWAAMELEARAVALTRHDEFLFQPNRSVHDIPPIIFSLGAAVLLQKP